MFNSIKALHLVFMVSWFAGLFYLVRLFVYHVEAQDKAHKEVLTQQFLIMERRLWYGITWPSCILTLLFGGAMIPFFTPLTHHPWLLVKLFFVAGLVLYHLSCGHLYRKLKTNPRSYTSTQMRIWNEVATVFLVSLVFLAVLKDFLALIPALIGLIGLFGGALGTIFLYRKIRSHFRRTGQ